MLDIAGGILLALLILAVLGGLFAGFIAYLQACDREYIRKRDQERDHPL